MANPDAIIIGAGPAGLACAATMRGAGLNVAVFEKAGNVGSAWRRHYDRLHLHTDRNHSGLPGMDMPRAYSAYPSRLQVIEYLESYAARFDIRPVFGNEVSCLRRDGAQWCAQIASWVGLGSRCCCRDRYRECAIPSILAGLGGLSRRDRP